MRAAETPAVGSSVNVRILAVLLALSVFSTARAVHAVATLDMPAFVFDALAHGAFYLAAVGLVLRRRAGPGDLLLILVGAVLLRGIAMTAPANLTTDALRYVWDGRIQWEGFNPYLYVPADPRLEYLRDALIYPDINQKETAVTIYPPVAQLLFALGVKIIDGIEGMKLVMVAFEALVVWATLRLLVLMDLPRERVVIYAWHPVPIWELASQAHLDAIAMGFMMLAILLVWQRRQGVAGVVLALGVLTKYFPLVLVPALWRRWDWRAPVAFVVTAALLYLPYWWGAGSGVLGFLFNHLDNEGYGQGYGFHIIWLLRDYYIASPHPAFYLVPALAWLAGAALWAFTQRRADEVRPEHLIMLGALFVFVTSPHYPWYFAWLVPLLVLRLHAGVLAMTLLSFLLYLPVHHPTLNRSTVYILVFGSYFVGALAHWLQRRYVKGSRMSSSRTSRS
jgi:alpha-1,6-mannosyltransferase